MAFSLRRLPDKGHDAIADILALTIGDAIKIELLFKEVAQPGFRAITEQFLWRQRQCDSGQRRNGIHPVNCRVAIAVKNTVQCRCKDRLVIRLECAHAHPIMLLTLA